MAVGKIASDGLRTHVHYLMRSSIVAELGQYMKWLVMKTLKIELLSSPPTIEKQQRFTDAFNGTALE